MRKQFYLYYLATSFILIKANCQTVHFGYNAENKATYIEYFRYRLSQTNDYSKYYIINLVIDAYSKFPKKDMDRYDPDKLFKIIEKIDIEYQNELKLMPTNFNTNYDNYEILFKILKTSLPKEPFSQAILEGFSHVGKVGSLILDSKNQVYNQRVLDFNNQKNFALYSFENQQFFEKIYDLAKSGGKSYNMAFSTAVQKYLSKFLNNVSPNTPADAIFQIDKNFETNFKTNKIYEKLKNQQLNDTDIQKFLNEIVNNLEQQFLLSTEINNNLLNLYKIQISEIERKNQEAKFQKELYDQELKIEGLRSATYLLSTFLSLNGKEKVANQITSIANLSLSLASLTNKYSSSVLETGLNGVLSGLNYYAGATSIIMSFVSQKSGNSFENITLQSLAQIQKDIAKLQDIVIIGFDRLEKNIINLQSQINDNFYKISIELNNLNTSINEVKSNLIVNQKLILSLDRDLDWRFNDLNNKMTNISDMELQSALNDLSLYKQANKINKVDFEKLEKIFFNWAITFCNDNIHAGSKNTVIDYNNFDALSQNSTDQIINPLLQYLYIKFSDSVKVVTNQRLPNPIYWTIAADNYLALMRVGKNFVNKDKAIYQNRAKKILDNGKFIRSGLESITYADSLGVRVYNTHLISKLFNSYFDKLFQLNRTLDELDEDLFKDEINESTQNVLSATLDIINGDDKIKGIHNPYSLVDSLEFKSDPNNSAFQSVIAKNSLLKNLGNLLSSNPHPSFNAPIKSFEFDDTLKLFYTLKKYKYGKLSYIPKSLHYTKFKNYKPTDPIEESDPSRKFTAFTNIQHIEILPYFRYSLRFASKSGYFDVSQRYYYPSKSEFKDITTWGSSSGSVFNKYDSNIDFFDIYSYFIKKGYLDSTQIHSKEALRNRSDIFDEHKQILMDSLLSFKRRENYLTQIKLMPTSKLNSILDELRKDREIIKLVLNIGFPKSLNVTPGLYSAIYAENSLMDKNIFINQIYKNIYNYDSLLDSTKITPNDLSIIEKVIKNNFGYVSKSLLKNKSSMITLLKQIPIPYYLYDFCQIFKIDKTKLINYEYGCFKQNFIPTNLNGIIPDVVDDFFDNLFERKYIERQYMLDSVIADYDYFIEN